MKPLNLLKSLFFGTSIIVSSLAIETSQAIAFSEQEVNQQQFIAVAIPYNYKEYRLEIIEQLPGGQSCWRESGVNPVTVELLLNNFDYTNSCRRISNTNGYTLRIDGQDDIVARTDKIVARNGELQLVAFHKDPTQADLVIGTTGGISENQPLKIMLNQGWRITKRVHNGQTLNHVYISGSALNTQNVYQPSIISTANPTSPNSAGQNTAPIGNSNAPLNNIPQNTTAPTTTSTLDPNSLLNTVNQMYGTYVNPLLNTVVGGISTASNYGNYCQGIAIITEPSASPQNASVYADGTLVFNNQSQLNIRPSLAQNGINPDQFLFQKSSAAIDFDNDGIVEQLTIEQPVSACR
jgi:hypothetical protein